MAELNRRLWDSATLSTNHTDEGAAAPTGVAAASASAGIAFSTIAGRPPTTANARATPDAIAVEPTPLPLPSPTSTRLWEILHEHRESDIVNEVEEGNIHRPLYAEMEQQYDQNDNATFITLSREVRMRYLKIKFFDLADTWRNHALHVVSIQGIGDVGDTRQMTPEKTRGVTPAFVRAHRRDLD